MSLARDGSWLAKSASSWKQEGRDCLPSSKRHDTAQEALRKIEGATLVGLKLEATEGFCHATNILASHHENPAELFVASHRTKVVLWLACCSAPWLNCRSATKLTGLWEGDSCQLWGTPTSQGDDEDKMGKELFVYLTGGRKTCTFR